MTSTATPLTSRTSPLLLIDVINDLEFEGGDNFGRWRSDFGVLLARVLGWCWAA